MTPSVPLIHDVGKWLLAANLPEDYAQVLQAADERSVPITEEESSALGTTHPAIGAHLLGLWGLPLDLLEAVAWHHGPQASLDQEFSILTAVHAANALSHEKAKPEQKAPAIVLDEPYLQRLHLLDRRNRWRERCGVPKKSEEDGADEKRERRQASKLK